MNSVIANTVEVVDERESTLNDYIDVVKRRRKPFIAITAMILTLAVGLAFLLPPVYRSSAVVLIEQQEIPTDLVRSTITNYADERIQILSKKVLTEENFKRILESSTMFEGIRDTVDERLLISKLKQSVTLQLMNAEMLGGALGGGGSRNARTTIAFRLSVDSENNPEPAQEAAAALVELFLEENKLERTQIAANTVEFLTNESDYLTQRLRELEFKIAEFKGKNFGALPEQMSANQTIIERLEREISEVDRQILSNEQRNFMLQSDLGKMSSFLDQPQIQNELGERVMSKEGRIQTLRSQLLTLLSRYSVEHPDILRIRNEMTALGGDPDQDGSISLIYNQLSSAEQELLTARRMYTADHPDVIRLEQRVQSLRREIGKNQKDFGGADLGFKKVPNPSYLQMQGQVKANQAEVESLKSKRAQLSTKIREMEQTFVRAPSVELEMRDIQREYEQTKSALDETTKKLRQAKVSESLETDQKGERLILLEAPVVSKTPVEPNKKLLLGGGLVLSLFAAFAFVLLLESMDRTIASRQVLANLTGTQPIGVIPFIRSRSEIQQAAQAKRLKRGLVVAAAIAFMLIASYVHINVQPLNVLWGEAIDQVSTVEIQR